MVLIRSGPTPVVQYAGSFWHYLVSMSSNLAPQDSTQTRYVAGPGSSSMGEGGLAIASYSELTGSNDAEFHTATFSLQF